MSLHQDSFKKALLKIILLGFMMMAAAMILKGEIIKSKKTGYFVSDFTAYWSAFHLAESGRNPYDPDVFRSFKNEIHYERPQENNYVFWYAPWFLSLFAPFLAWPFEISATLWLLVNLCFPVAISCLSWKLFAPARSQPMAVLFLAGILLAPFLFLLRMGQMSFWTGLGVIGCVLALEKKQDFWAGCFLVLTTIKPQTIFLLYPVLGLWMIQNKRFHVLASWIGILLLLNLAAFIWWPSLHFNWIHTAEHPLDYTSTTLASFLSVRTGSEMPLWVLPSLALLSVGYYYFRHPVIWSSALPLVLCLSLIFMPYGGFSDFNLLAILQTAMAARLTHPGTSSRQRYLVLAAMLIYHLLTLIVLYCCGRNLHQLWWYPWGYLGFWGFISYPFKGVVNDQQS